MEGAHVPTVPDGSYSLPGSGSISFTYLPTWFFVIAYLSLS